MYDIEFKRIGSGYYTKVSHGQSHFLGKLDSGSPITLFNLAAIQLFTNQNEQLIKDAIRFSGTPCLPFKGYNGISSVVYLCGIHNVSIGKKTIDKMWIGASLDYPLDKDGKPITKCLIGTDILFGCKGLINYNGSIELSVCDDQRQEQEMRRAFLVPSDRTDIFQIDEMV